MKKKSIIAGIALLICLSFGQAASAGYGMDPGENGGNPPKPPTCKSYPCPT